MDIQAVGKVGNEAMAYNFSPDSEPTTRTLLRQVLDTAVPRTPRRARSTRSGYVRALRQHKSNHRPCEMRSRADSVWRGKLEFRRRAEPRTQTRLLSPPWTRVICLCPNP